MSTASAAGNGLMAKAPKKETQQEYRQRIIGVVCGITSETTLGIQRICKLLKEKDADHPACRTIREWLRDDEELAAQYARAKEIQLQNLAEEIIEISDDDSQDEIFTDEGKRMLNSEFVQRSKLRVDSRKWLLSKLVPKVYGDKVDLNHSGTITLEHALSAVADECD